MENSRLCSVLHPQPKTLYENLAVQPDMRYLSSEPYQPMHSYCTVASVKVWRLPFQHTLQQSEFMGGSIIASSGSGVCGPVSPMGLIRLLSVIGPQLPPTWGNEFKVLQSCTTETMQGQLWALGPHWLCEWLIVWSRCRRCDSGLVGWLAWLLHCSWFTYANYEAMQAARFQWTGTFFLIVQHPSCKMISSNPSHF